MLPVPNRRPPSYVAVLPIFQGNVEPHYCRASLFALFLLSALKGHQGRRLGDSMTGEENFRTKWQSGLRVFWDGADARSMIEGRKSLKRNSLFKHLKIKYLHLGAWDDSGIIWRKRPSISPGDFGLNCGLACFVAGFLLRIV